MKSQSKFVSYFFSLHSGFFFIFFVLSSRIIVLLYTIQWRDSMASFVPVCAHSVMTSMCTTEYICACVLTWVWERETVHAFLGLSKSKPRLKIGASIQPLTDYIHAYSRPYMDWIPSFFCCCCCRCVCVCESLLSIYCRLVVSLAFTARMCTLKPATYERNKILWTLSLENLVNFEN